MYSIWIDMLCIIQVYFCKDQVFWECRKIRCAESFPDDGLLNLPSRHPIMSDGQLKWLVPGQSLAQYGRRKSRVRSEYWSAVVDKYSKCDLTFVHDKLIALSGIARD
jgi:hypothetical protein